MNSRLMKRVVLIVDAIVIALVMIALASSTSINQINSAKLNARKAPNADFSFNLIANPKEKRVKAGETVTIKLTAEDINVGENGLNSIVGYLGYDESLFESVDFLGGDTINGYGSEWKVELNKRKGHAMYGKFCIYTMREGITENEVVATMVVKLKSDLKPQTTKITFTKLASSDGEVEVLEEDRAVTLIIYDDPESTPDPDPEPESDPTPDDEEVKTGDSIVGKVLILVAATAVIMLNVSVFRKNKKLMSIITLMLVSLTCVAVRVEALPADANISEIISNLDYKQKWLNSNDYLVTKDDISRIEPETLASVYASKVNKEINIYEKDEDTLIDNNSVIGTGMRAVVKNLSKYDADSYSQYAISVWGDTNGDGKSNQVELTTIIRNTLDKEKWALSGVKYKSADVTVNNEIDENDVDASVMYIVYGEKEIPSFNSVVEPTIEVVEGNYDEESESYTTSVRVKISELENDALSTEYKVENSEGVKIPFTEIAESSVDENGKHIHEFKLLNNEVYKISAYTTGKLGNRSEIPYKIIHVNKANDTVELGIPTISHTPTTWTNQDVTVTITKSALEPEGTSIKYRVQGTETWNNYTQAFTIGENCTIEAKLTLDVLEGETVTHPITNIDKVKPVFENVAQSEDGENRVKITVSATDNLSGIVEYGIKKSADSQFTTTSCDVDSNGTGARSKNIVFQGITSNGTYILKLKDAAGNEETHTEEVTSFPVVYVAKIVEAPEGYKILEGTVYEKLEFALTTSDMAAQAGHVRIQIIGEINDESNTIKPNRDYTIDLNDHLVQNNHLVQNEEESYALKVQGKLQIVDDGTDDEKGVLKSVYGEAVYVEYIGSFTLGEDDTTLQAGFPNTEEPRIEGSTCGVKKQANESAEIIHDEESGVDYYPEGIYNFYDGVVIGGVRAHELNVIDDTPILFVSHVDSNAATGKSEARLTWVADIEATIEKKRYTRLENAIEEANTVFGDSENPVTINVVNDITRNSGFEIPEDKNIILDLNGHTISSNSSYMHQATLRNYGKLIITDSSQSIDETTGEDIKGTGKIVNLNRDGVTIVNAAKPFKSGDEKVKLNLHDIVERTEDGYTAFEKVGSGTNQQLRIPAITESTKAYGEIILDLTNKEGMYSIDVSASESGPSGNSNIKYGKVVICEEETGAFDNTGFELYGSGRDDDRYGYTVHGGRKYKIKVMFTCDDVGNGSGRSFNLSNITYRQLTGYGDLTIEKGSITGKNGDTKYNDGKIINYGKLVIGPSAYPSVIENHGGKLQYNNGKADLEDAAIIAYPGGNCEITNFNGNSITNLGRMNIDDFASGTLSSYALISVTKGTFDGVETFANGTFGNISAKSLDHKEGTITINNLALGGGETQNHKVLYTTAKIDIKKANITSSDQIEIDEGGELKIDDGTCTLSESNGKIINNGTLNLGKGTYSSNYKNLSVISAGVNSNTTIKQANVISSGENSVAITTDGQLTIGNSEDELSVETPKIEGVKSAINAGDNATVNFLNGELVGPVNSVVEGRIDTIREGYDLIKETKEDSKEHYTLGTSTNRVARIAATTDINLEGLNENKYALEEGYYYFYNVYTAIETAKDNTQTTIELLEDNLLLNNKISVGENKKITIDFNGHPTSTLASLAIENSGELKLTSSSETRGKITQQKGNLIVNNAGAKFTAENIELVTEDAKLGADADHKENTIFNAGTMKFDNSVISIRSEEENGEHRFACAIKGTETSTLELINTTFFTNVMTRMDINSQGDGTTNNQTIIRGSTLNNDRGVYTDLLINNDGNVLIENTSIAEFTRTYNNTTGTMTAIKVSAPSAYIYNNRNSSLKIMGTENNIRCVDNEEDGSVYVEGGSIDLVNNRGEFEGKNFTTYVSGLTSEFTNAGTAVVYGTTKISTVNNSGTFTLKQGVVEGSITNVGTDAILNYGDRDAELGTNPVVKYGVSNASGKFYFYNGIIMADAGSSVTGSLSGVRQGKAKVVHAGPYKVEDGTEDGIQIREGREVAVLEDSQNCVTLSSTGEGYSSIAEALYHAAAEDTITCILDFNVAEDEGSIYVPEGIKITFDINGKNIVFSNNDVIVNGGTFILTDSATEKGSITANQKKFMLNMGTATINNCNISYTQNGTSTDMATMIENDGGILTLQGSTSIAMSKAQYLKLINSTNGTVTLKDQVSIAGNLRNGRAFYIINSENTNVNIQGGSFSLSGSGDPMIKVDGGEFNVSQVDGGNTSFVAQTEISNCQSTISGGYLSQVQTGEDVTLNVSGGTVNTLYSAMGVTEGTLNITGGTFTSITSNYDEVSISGGTIDQCTCGTTDSTVTISGSLVNVDGNDVYSTTINQLSCQGDVTIKDYVELGTVSYSRPNSNDTNDNWKLKIGDGENITNRVKITSNSFGINANGTVEYYGGTIIGNPAVSGNISKVADGYRIVRTISDGKEKYEIAAASNVASDNEDHNYTSLAAAVAGVGDNGTITLLEDIVLTEQDAIVVPEGKTITINVNGKQVNCHDSSNNPALTNRGTLKLVNGLDEQAINLNCYNYGNLEANRVKFNKGIYNYNEGTILVNNGLVTALISTSSGDITIKNSTIDVIQLASIGETMTLENCIINQPSNRYYNIKTSYPVGDNIDTLDKIVINIRGLTTSITDGQFELDRKGELNIEAGSITNTTFTSNQYSSDVDINVTGGSFENTNFTVKRANILFRGVSITTATTNINGFYNLTIDGVTINGHVGGVSDFGASENHKSSTTTITNDGHVISPDWSTALSGGMLKLVSGSVEANYDYEGLVAVSSASVIMGDINKIPNETNPVIKAEHGYGMSSCSFSMYGGVIQGGIAAYSNSVPGSHSRGFEIKSYEDNKVVKLGVVSDVEDFVEVNDSSLSDLNTAITEAGNNGTIIVNHGAVIDYQIIVDGIDVTIDLRGCEIDAYTTEPTIVTRNGGKLTITDSTSSNNSKIINCIGKVKADDANVVGDEYLSSTPSGT